MPVYMVAELKIHDPDAYAEYARRLPETVHQHGGRYLVRGGTVLPLVGAWDPERVVILEFPTVNHLREWLSSEEYQELAPLRIRSSSYRAFAVEGCAGQDC